MKSHTVPMGQRKCVDCGYLIYPEMNLFSCEGKKEGKAKMKKYRCRQLLADVGRGAIFEKKENGYVHQINEKSYIGFPSYIVENNADWFEPIEEKSDEERLAGYLLEQFRDHIVYAHSDDLDEFKTLAKHFIHWEVINLEFIEKLRKDIKC